MSVPKPSPLYSTGVSIGWSFEVRWESETKIFLGPRGGSITWLTSDTQGCLNFELNQSGPGRPPASVRPAPTSTTEPSPPPQTTMGVIKTTCNTQDMDPRFIQLTADVPPAIPDFCGKADNLKSGPGSSENKQIGNKQINSKNTILLLPHTLNSQFSTVARILLFASPLSPSDKALTFPQWVSQPLVNSQQVSVLKTLLRMSPSSSPLRSVRTL
jgi:hypothetical protein